MERERYESLNSESRSDYVDEALEGPGPGRVVAVADLDASSGSIPPAPWREDVLFKRLATALDTVRAIDNHTHLRGGGDFDPDLDAFASSAAKHDPWLPSVLNSRFGVTFVAGDWKQTTGALGQARDAMIARLTEQGYWLDISTTHARILPYLIQTCGPGRMVDGSVGFRLPRLFSIRYLRVI